MNNGLESVRESIRKRRNVRVEDRKVSKTVLPLVATYEEKHGFDDVSPFDYTITNVKQKKSKKINSVYKSLIGAIIFFLACFIVLQMSSPSMKPAKEWLETALQKEFPFAKVASWYGDKFGDPLALSPDKKIRDGQAEYLYMPVMGDVVETFSTNGTGIMISPKEESAVTATNEGIVIFAGNDKKTKKTIIVQHADNSQTTYGYLSALDVYLYQFVNSNELIATFTPSEQNQVLYYSIEKENKYIDPTEVIQVDVQP